MPPDSTTGPDSPLHQTSDLLKLAKEGSLAARDELTARYLPRLQRWASGRLPNYARSLLDTSDVSRRAKRRDLRAESEHEALYSSENGSDHAARFRSATSVNAN